jgi:predicted MFS family arabinose efflux permease
VLSEKIGWAHFFVLTSVVGLPAILLIIWIGSRDGFSKDYRKPAI